MPYLSGGASVDMWTDAAAYLMGVENFFIFSVPPPRIESISVSGSAVTISWSALVGQRYRLQSKDGPGSGAWQDVVPDVIASSATAAASVTYEGVPLRLYRVMQVP